MLGHLSKHCPENHVSVLEPLSFYLVVYKYDKSLHCLIKRFV